MDIGASPNINTGAVMQPANQGYQGALSSLQKSLKMMQGSDSSQLMQAQQGLAQNQGKVQQGLINSGLGNTTVAQTMQQAPLQTYNTQVAGIHNNMQHQMAQGYNDLAGAQLKGGMDLGNLLLASQGQQENMDLQAQKQQRMKPGYGPGLASRPAY